MESCSFLFFSILLECVFSLLVPCRSVGTKYEIVVVVVAVLCVYLRMYGVKST